MGSRRIWGRRNHPYTREAVEEKGSGGAEAACSQNCSVDGRRKENLEEKEK